jgi:hypothetical protein
MIAMAAPPRDGNEPMTSYARSALINLVPSSLRFKEQSTPGVLETAGMMIGMQFKYN